MRYQIADYSDLEDAPANSNIVDTESEYGDYCLCACANHETAKKVADALNAADSRPTEEEIDAALKRLDGKVHGAGMQSGDEEPYMEVIAAIEWAVGRPFSGRDNSVNFRWTPVWVKAVLMDQQEI